MKLLESNSNFLKCQNQFIAISLSHIKRMTMDLKDLLVEKKTGLHERLLTAVIINASVCPDLETVVEKSYVHLRY
jgi:hypothetical protein